MSLLDIEFIVTVGGKDLTPCVTSWTFSDVEDGLSTIKVVFANNGFRDPMLNPNFGDLSLMKFIGEDVSLSYKSNTSGAWHTYTMSILKQEEHHHSDGVSTLSITGMDESHKLDGKSVRGHCKKGETKKDALERIVKKFGINPVIPVTPAPVPKHYKWGMSGQASYQINNALPSLNSGEGKK